MLRASPPVAFALALVFTILGAPRVAGAHSLLVNPPPLIADDSAKSGPCGCYFGAGPEDPTEDATASKCPANYTTTSLVAGSQLKVSWKETVNHDGAFRLAFSPTPVDGVVKADLDANVLYEKPDTNTVAGTTITATITVPDTPCASCTLQLRQLMTGAAKPYYWSCAAIKIVPAGGSTGATTGSGPSGAGGAGAGGAGGDGQGVSSPAAVGAGGSDSTAAGPAATPIPFKTGACSVSSGDAEPGFGTALLAAVMAMTLRIRRRHAR
jgi:MYXO-CTERM domain-containing protein